MKKIISHKMKYSLGWFYYFTGLIKEKKKSKELVLLEKLERMNN